MIFQISFYITNTCLFVDRSIDAVLRNGDLKVTGNRESHDTSPPVIVDVSMLSVAAEKMSLSNTSLHELQRDSPTGHQKCPIIDFIS